MRRLFALPFKHQYALSLRRTLSKSSCLFNVPSISAAAPPGVTVVRTKADAERALAAIRAAASPGRVFAVDTEVSNIDLSFQSPVGNGYVICASVFGGPDLDFGAGPRLWIDNYGDAEGVLLEFKEFLEDANTKKVNDWRAIPCA